MEEWVVGLFSVLTQKTVPCCVTSVFAMLSTLRSGRSIGGSVLATKLQLVRAHAPSGRTLSGGQVGRRIGRQSWKRCSSNETKTFVRAIPVESTRTGLTGTCKLFSVLMLFQATERESIL